MPELFHSVGGAGKVRLLRPAHAVLVRDFLSKRHDPAKLQPQCAVEIKGLSFPALSFKCLEAEFQCQPRKVRNPCNYIWVWIIPETPRYTRQLRAPRSHTASSRPSLAAWAHEAGAQWSFVWPEEAGGTDGPEHTAVAKGPSPPFGSQHRGLGPAQGPLSGLTLAQSLLPGSQQPPRPPPHSGLAILSNKVYWKQICFFFTSTTWVGFFCVRPYFSRCVHCVDSRPKHFMLIIFVLRDFL